MADVELVTRAAPGKPSSSSSTSANAAAVTQPARPPPSHGAGGKSAWTGSWFSWLCLALQLAIVVLYGTCTAFHPSISTTVEPSPSPEGAQQLNVRYAMYQDTHVMMLVGFGFLYTLLRRHAWTGVGINYLVTVVVLQLAVLCLGLWTAVRTGDWARIPLNIDSLINADYVAATCLISFGAVIGRVSATQMLVMAVVETLGAAGNVAVAAHLGVTDPGGSMLIHCFGASFGLAMAYTLGDPAARTPGGEDKLGTSRHNGTFAMVGTLFLFCFWPSFNAALLVGAAQHRAVINTVLSISASTVVAFALSRAVHRGARFDMEHVQNATLAGGVAIGAACDMLSNPWGALLTGSVAGAVSSYGFSFLAPVLKRAGLTDTCGIAHLHLLPALIGGVASAVAAAGLTGDAFSDEALAASFPLRAEGKSAGTVGGLQMAMTVISFVFGSGLGAATGALIRLPFAEPLAAGGFYEDAAEWNVPFDEEETPELDDELAAELHELERGMERQRAAITADVLARLAKAGVVVPKGAQATAADSERNQEAGGGAPGSPRGAGRPRTPVMAAAAAAALSANERFFEGSTHGGRAFAASKGEMSAHGGSRFRGVVVAADGEGGGAAAP
jgi:ammonium transporter Rh